MENPKSQYLTYRCRRVGWTRKRAHRARESRRRRWMDAPTSRYHEVYARWQRDPEEFWGDAARAIDWYEQPNKIFDSAAGVYGRWFVGGVCNTCWNAVDRHVLGGRADQAALIYDSPVTNTNQAITYSQLQERTQLLAGILKDLGV